MATITSTIKLVDQMTPTLNKISKAIDRVNGQSRAMGNVKTWNGFNAGARTATKSTHSLYNALRRTAFILGSLKGLQSFANVADTMMNANARINNITNDLEKTKYYMDAIYLSAQRSRSAFMTTANSVGKLATLASSAFDGSMEQVIAFTELMNKMFVISGASAAEASNAMYQLTQAMAAGKLQGDEMRSILENAPMLAQKLAEKLGVSVGEIKDLGAEGKITADIIKEALFESADEIEKKFENMPKTIGQTWTEISNYALNAFRPVIDRVQQFINSPIFEKFKSKLFGIITKVANGIIRLFDLFETPRIQNAIAKICNAFSVLWEIASWVGNAMVQLAIWISENWGWIAPIIYTIAWAFLVYKAAVAIATVAMWAYNAAQLVAGIIAGTVVLTTFGWVVLIIVALIAVIYLAVAAWNHFTGDTVSGTGIIFGAIAFVVAGIIWLIQTLIDVIKGIGWLIGQVFIDLVDFIAILFADIIMFLCQLVVAAIALVIDAVVFVGDIIGSIIDIVVFVGKIIGQVFSDVVETLASVIYNIIVLVTKLLSVAITAIVEVGGRLWDTLVWIAGLVGTLIQNILKFIGNIIMAVCEFLRAVGENIGGTFDWIGAVISTWGSNMLTGMSQLCDHLPDYWEIFKLRVAAKIWELVVKLGQAFNSMAQSSRDGVVNMLKPFEGLVNGFMNLLQTLKTKWNDFVGGLGISAFGYEIWSGDSLKITKDFSGTWSADGWVGQAPKVNVGAAVQKAAQAHAAANAILSNTPKIDWNTNDLPKYGDYADWGSTIDALKEGFKTFEYGEFEENPVSWDWSAIGDELKAAWDIIDFKSFEGIWNGEDYLNDWNDFKATLAQIWDPESYLNPLDAFVWEAYENPFSAFEGEDYIKIWEDFKKNFSENINPFEVAKEWYDKGAALEDGISGFIDGIGALLDGLFGSGKGSEEDGYYINGDWFPNSANSNAAGVPLPDSLEDLLGGYSGNGDALGAIADNTGKTAGSAGNIEDTLDLAEEELELLRKIAEQEVINRFTTAEIHVDMTNNNNVSSNMDLDGIVTHLSNKLYEELGVVASGVHY